MKILKLIPLTIGLLLVVRLGSADVNPVKGGRYLYNGVAACSVVGVGGAGVRIKFESGGMKDLDMDTARKVLSIPGGCQASNITETRKQLAMIDRFEKDHQAWGDVDGLFNSDGTAKSVIQ